MGKTLHPQGRWWRCPHRYTIHKRCWRVSDDKGEIGRHLRKVHKYTAEERTEEWRKGCPTMNPLLAEAIGSRAWRADFEEEKKK